MIIECPYCHTRILPKADGSCPACGKNTQDRLGTDANKTSLVVSPGMRLPGICIICGGPAAELQCISKRHHMGEDSNKGQSSVGLGLMGGALGWLLRIFFMRGSRSVAVDVPVCKGCNKQVNEAVRYVNHERGTMTFIVHRNVKDEIEKLGASS
jgi:hypothetical protein